MHRVAIVTKVNKEIVAVHHVTTNTSKVVLRKIVAQFRREGRIDNTMTIIWEEV